MRDCLLGLLSAVVAAIALAWRHGMRYHEVAAQPPERPAIASVPVSPPVAAQPPAANQPAPYQWPYSTAQLAAQPQVNPKVQLPPFCVMATVSAFNVTLPGGMTLHAALTTAYERGLVDGIARANTDYERGRADAFRLPSTPSLN